MKTLLKVIARHFKISEARAEAALEGHGAFVYRPDIEPEYTLNPYYACPPGTRVVVPSVDRNVEIVVE